ncbi:MAG: shikimate kinase [Eubacteriaceae bacterium]|nr:shikimate kinase [Eubacteriaceae bacterium]
MDNIILIGMPGCGKSTAGVVLAKVLGYGFIDSDLVIQEHEGKRLNEILDSVGPWGFNKIEDDINAGIMAEKTVIATGGSAVYGKKAMKHFSDSGKIVYLELSAAEIEKRVGSIEDRGISIEEGMDIRALYEERKPLYEKYADVTVNTEGLDIPRTVEAIIDALEK